MYLDSKDNYIANQRRGSFLESIIKVENLTIAIRNLCSLVYLYNFYYIILGTQRVIIF